MEGPIHLGSLQMTDRKLPDSLKERLWGLYSMYRKDVDAALAKYKDEPAYFPGRKTSWTRLEFDSYLKDSVGTQHFRNVFLPQLLKYEDSEKNSVEIRALLDLENNKAA